MRVSTIMLFTIEAYNGVWGLDASFRLRKDGKWTEQTDFKDVNKEEDMLFHTFGDARGWLTQNPQVEIEGKNYSTDIQKEGKLWDKSNYHFEIIVHRMREPRIFTKREVEKVLRAGNDNVDTSLIIDFEGVPHLVPWDDLERGNYAVRYETFVAGSKHVGINSPLNHLNRTYSELIEGWRTHLQCGRSISIC